MKLQYMMLGLILGCVFTLSCCGGSTGLAAADKVDIQAVVTGNNVFTLDLYPKLAQDKGNLFFSPYSITSALAMTYAGARGATAAQMASALRFTLDPAKLHPAMAELMNTFNAPGKSYRLAVANALWGQAGYPFFPEFLQVTKSYYGAGFKEVDYRNATEQARQTINQWVEAKTNQKIKELIKPKILNALTRLVLTNAIYFKGKWESQYKTEHTKEAPFYVSAQEKQTVPLMYQVGKFNYMETDQLQMVELPYTGGDLVMVVLLPKPQSNLAQLEAALTPANLQAWLAKLSKVKVNLFLPRFKLEKDFQLNEVLQALGMKDAFDEQAADFSGISKGSLYITKVLHKSFVEVNEEGTEAAAATAVILGTKSVDQPVTFRADHPFVFLIRDLRSGTILFMGRLVNPR